MNEPDTQFNTSYRFDDDLRDVPDDRAGMEGAARLLEERLQAEDLEASEKLRALGRLGVYLRILGRLDEGQKRLEEAVTLAVETGDEKAVLVNRIRLGHVFQWQRRFEEADRLFADAIERCKQDERFRQYLDFAYQHYGKSKFDQGLYAEAEALFKQALEIRREKGDASLVESSQQALQTTRKRMSNE